MADITFTGPTVTPSGTIEPRATFVQSGRIVSSDLIDPTHPDFVGDQLISPGLIDLQVNGALGNDLTKSPDTVWEVAAALPRFGVTAFLPTIITGPAEAALVADRVLEAPPPGHYAQPLGLHLEGPLISTTMRGTHPVKWVTNDREATRAWINQMRNIAMVTLAPELDSDDELTSALSAAGIVVSIGHTAAVDEDVHAAAEAGATVATHLCNAMPPLSHRGPSATRAILANDSLYATLIADGHHLEPDMLQIAARTLGKDRLILVTDAMAALGLGDGQFHLGDVAVTVRDGDALNNSGGLAGAVSSLSSCVQVLERASDMTLADAIQCASANPARVLNDRTRGHISPDARADFALFDQEMNTVATYVGGTRVFPESA